MIHFKKKMFKLVFYYNLTKLYKFYNFIVKWVGIIKKFQKIMRILISSVIFRNIIAALLTY